MLNTLAKRFNNIRAARRTITELQRMDDRMLSDIGVARGDIDRMVRFGR